MTIKIKKSLPLFKAFLDKKELLEGQPKTSHRLRGNDGETKIKPLTYEQVMGGYLIDHNTAGITKIAHDPKSGVTTTVDPEYASPDMVLDRLASEGIEVVTLVGPSWKKMGKKPGAKVTLADAKQYVSDLMEDQKGLEIAKGASGEGSKGGKVIGHTKSGKPIYDHFEHPGHSTFTPKDHEHAAMMHDSHGVGVDRKIIGRINKKEGIKSTGFYSDSDKIKNFSEKFKAETTPKERQKKEHHRLQANKHAEASYIYENTFGEKE